MRAEQRERILVAGAPRSGTTWVGKALGRCQDTVYVHEPDTHNDLPYAFHAKRRIGRRFHPPLTAGQAGPLALDARPYEELWRQALGIEDRMWRSRNAREKVSRRAATWLLHGCDEDRIARALWDSGALSPPLRAADLLAEPEHPIGEPRHVVAKSVYVALSVEWIAARIPSRVVIVLRDPLNTLSSWLEMGWLSRKRDILGELDPAVCRDFSARSGIALPKPDASQLVRGTWMLGLLTAHLRDAAARHPEWEVVEHERLLECPHELFTELAEALRLDWGEEAKEFVEATNRPGTGYELTRDRDAAAEAWRARLSQAQVREIEAVLAEFPA